MLSGRLASCTASTASQQLAALERDLGAALLERSAHSVRLTQAGHVLVEHAARVLAELDAATQAVHDAAGLRGGRLSIAAFASANALVVPALVSFRTLHPGVRLSMLELEPEQAIPAVAAGEIDVALTHQYRQLPKPDLCGLRQVLLRRERLVLALPPHLRPTQPNPGRLADYADATGSGRCAND